MIDWNNNGRIDPEEIFLTEEILGEEDEESVRLTRQVKHSGCLFSLLTLLLLPIFLLKGFYL